MASATRKLSLSLTAALFFTGCATESITVRVLRPAPVNLGQYEKIAVDVLKGEGGAELTEDLVVALRSTKNPLTGQVDFDVLDRREGDKILDDLKEQRGKRWNKQVMSMLDEWNKEWQSVEVLIKGEVPGYTVEEIVKENEWADKDGAQHTKYSRQAVANVTVIIEAFDANSDKVLDSVTLQEVASRAATATDKRPPSIDHGSLLATARNNVVHRYLRRITPREEYIQVKLFKDGDFPELHVGNGFAKTGAWDGALKSYSEALSRMTGELAASRYKALFNIGVALQYTNQFDEAKKALKEAYALQQDDMILKELQNVGVREDEYQKLLEQA